MDPTCHTKLYFTYELSINVYSFPNKINQLIGKSAQDEILRSITNSKDDEMTD